MKSSLCFTTSPSAAANPGASTLTAFPLNAISFCAWLSQAEPGETIEYHRGFLALDRYPFISRLSDRERGELIRLSKRAFQAAERGLAHLVQHRHGPDDYSYLVVARPRLKRAHVRSLSNLIMAEVA